MKLYKCVDGGQIGYRFICVAAKIRVAKWAKKVNMMLYEIGVEVSLTMIYVDDGRWFTTPVPLGHVNNVRTEELEH